MENTEHQRQRWLISLHSKFCDALKNCTQEFTWQEKADFVEQLIGYVQVMQNSEDEAATFFTEKIMKPFRLRLKAIDKVQLFKFFDRDLALVEFGVITTEEFNDLPYAEKGMSEEEYEMYLSNITRSLKSEQYFHYMYHSDKEEDASQDTMNGISVKGRAQRSHGDNLTKLNQEQIALFIDYLKEGRIILKDEYLNGKQAGLAFHILTGYSPDALRIKLGKKEISKIKTKENLTELHNVLTQLTILINKDISNLKKT